ncbi:uncharacterized protein LOC143446236 [Clavelina lepadiformis]|uniref:Uncharacterized protein n=1 Tax=Clavelina lepadiformis TaxID=159417 RepID=A0ABP0GUE8_CLALP
MNENSKIGRYPPLVQEDTEICEGELERNCWKCYKEKDFLKQARRNYDDVMSGHVEQLLVSLIDRWKEDSSVLGLFSLFGSQFSFVRTWTESRLRRRRKARKSFLQPKDTTWRRSSAYVSHFMRNGT